MMKRVLVVVLLSVVGLVTAACPADSMRHVSSANSDVQVQVLTEFDGVRLYRVQDGSSQTVYVAVQHSSLSTQWEQSCGKGCVEHKEVATVRVQ